MVTGRAVPDVARDFEHFNFRDGLIRFPDVWLLRCGPPPGAFHVDFDDQQIDRRPVFPEDSDIFMSGVSFPDVVAPAIGTATAPNAFTANVNPSTTPRFDGEGLAIHSDTRFTYLGLHVGLAEEVAGPIRVEFAARGTGTSWIDVDQVELGPSASPATSCLMIAAPAGETFRSGYLRAYSSDGTRVPLIVDSVYWSHTEDYPIEPQPDPITVEFIYPTPAIRLTTAHNTPIMGRVTWPQGRQLDWVSIASPNWDKSGLVVRRADLGRSRNVGDQRTAVFFVNAIEVPSGPFTVSATATGANLRGGASLDLEGLGPPSPPRSEYRDLIEGEVDVIPWAMEVTQAVRGPLAVQEPMSVITDDFNHASRKRTIVRGYATHLISDSLGIRPDQIFSNAVLHGTRNGETLSWSPLRPESSSTRLFGIEPGPSAERATRPFAANTFNFALPYSWTTGDEIVLRLEVNPPGSPEYIEELPGLGGWNNTISQRVSFADTGRVGVGVVNIDFHWKCTEDMVATEDSRHPCFGLEEGDEVSTVRTRDEIANAARGWWKTIPAAGDFPAYLTLGSVEIPHKDDDPRVAVDRTVGGRAATVSWEHWRNAYWDLYCGDSVLGPTQIRPPSVRDFVWMTQPNWAPLRGGGCAWVNKRTGFRANTFWATPAQEAGHTTGMRHTGTAHGELGGGKAAIRFGGDHGEIDLPGESTWGFDTSTMTVLNPGTSGHVHDYMSYGGGLVWTSVGTWNHMYRSLLNNETYGEDRGRVVSGSGGAESATSGAPGEGDAWILEGTVSEDGDVNVEPPYLGDAGILYFPDGDQVVVTVDTPDGPLALETGLTEANTHLGSSFSTFAVAFPVDIDPERVSVVVDGGDPIVLEPAGEGVGITLGDIGRDKINWDPGDADPPFTVEATDDDGESWWVLGETIDPELIIPPGVLPLAGDDWIVRIQGADGPRVHTTEEPVDFGVPSPVALIGSPLDGDRVPVGALRAYAADGSIGDDGSVYTWSVNGETFNEGVFADIPILPGENAITLAVENESGSDEHTITVQGVVDTDGDGLDDEWEEQHGLDPLVPDTVEDDVDEDGMSLGVEYQNQTDPNNPDTDEDGYSDGLELLGAGDPLDPMTIAGPIHGFDDSALVADPDMPTSEDAGIPVWVWILIVGALVAPLGYWLGKRGPGGHTGDPG